jgi:hypothetical protein
MATVIAVRALKRAKNVRVRAYDIAEDEYSLATLSPTEDTLVDVDDAESRNRLARHAAIGGGFVVTGTDIAVGGELGPS